MTKVDVDAVATADGWLCAVTVHDGDETRHQVHVSGGDLARLAPGASDPTDLVLASFGFLLEREPKASILRSFDLAEIGRYFPDYEAEMGRRRSG